MATAVKTPKKRVSQIVEPNLREILGFMYDEGATYGTRNTTVKLSEYAEKRNTAIEAGLRMVKEFSTQKEKPAK